MGLVRSRSEGRLLWRLRRGISYLDDFEFADLVQQIFGRDRLVGGRIDGLGGGKFCKCATDADFRLHSSGMIMDLY